MRQDAASVAQKTRPVPYCLQKPLKVWLEQCNAEDIFEEVQPGEPVTWCSPMVVQSKQRFPSMSKDDFATKYDPSLC